MDRFADNLVEDPEGWAGALEYRVPGAKDEDARILVRTLPGGRKVLLVDNPTAVLADALEGEMEVLVRRLRAAGETYGEPIALGESWDRPAVPFHVVLHAQSAEAEETSRRWTGAGAHVVPFT